MNQYHRSPLNIIVIVAALGYFVDIYDLILFGIVRIPSLRSLGVAEADLRAVGVSLANKQMLGMLLGGIVWGILGDKKGRLATLFGTILLYSLANIANGFVTNIEQYAWLRAIAGFGLAGELGIGITLVSEVMSKENRAYATSIVSGVGICGAVLAYGVSLWGWREAYWTGGALGLCLLALRIYVNESGMFARVKESGAVRGDFLSLFTNFKRFIKYLNCILIGLPVWFVIGILIIFSKEFGEALGITGTISPGKAIMFHYSGAAIGSILTGFISQKLKSRRKSIALAIFLVAICSAWYFSARGASPTLFFIIMFWLGVAQGYWAMFITVASEQFGTNIRSTVTTTVPNFVRGGTALMTLWWLNLSAGSDIIHAAIIVGSTVIVLALIAVWQMDETHGKDLDYSE
ncbi:MAG TPA: MFS transporter [Bacteroidia bacterium]|jgi:predicted MFS family arabinose efflux permease|nr:MFS transporter [Bacteroidia bacterium]